MVQAQFLIFGLLVVWFAGTGKLRALVDALRTEPSSAPTGNSSSTGQPPIVGPTGQINTSVIDLAQKQLGKNYQYGAITDTTLKTFFYDCSSLVQSVFGAMGVKLRRTSQQQAADAAPVSNPLPGDLAFGSFSGPNDHVGIYVGNGMAISALDEKHGVVSTAVKNWPGLHFGRVA